MKALQESTGTKLKDLKSQLAKIGDLGKVAEQCRNKQKTLFKPASLTVERVFKTLFKIASQTGNRVCSVFFFLVQKRFSCVFFSHNQNVCV